MIRHSMFPEKWPTMTLGHVVEFLDNMRVPVKQNERVPGPYPYYGANGLQGTIDNYLFDEPLVLLAEDGGHFGQAGKTIAYRVNGKCWVNNHAHVLRPTGKIDIGFLCHQLQSYDVTPYITGTTRGKLTKASACRIKIVLPPLSEQKRIAAILDKADAIRRKRKAALDMSDEFLRATFLDMFGDPVTNPKGWDVKPLSTLADIMSGVTKGKKLAGKETKTLPYMRVANVQDGRIDLDEIKTIEVSKQDAKTYLLQPGDLLLTEGGDPDKLGRGAVWHGAVAPCIHQNHIFRVRFDHNEVVPEFASVQIGSMRGKRYFLKAGKQTTGIASINKTQLSGFPFLMPPHALQQKFFTICKALKTKTESLAVLQAEADTLFASLSQSAFRGKL